jgi:imidazolonepropionase-like amidohydrolase
MTLGEFRLSNAARSRYRDNAATRHGAEVCGVGAGLGTVESGKLVDLIVVGANPLEDITNVR